jgi:hypothetical protein
MKKVPKENYERSSRNYCNQLIEMYDIDGSEKSILKKRSVSFEESEGGSSKRQKTNSDVGSSNKDIIRVKKPKNIFKEVKKLT